jgi:uncharacterized protein
MDPQSLWTAVLVIPALALGVVAWRTHGSSLGIDPRDGALGELLRGGAFSLPFFAALLAVFWGTGLSQVDGWRAVSPEVVGIWVYFLVLLLVEEVLFRGLFMAGLGVLAGQVVSLVVTSVLVAMAYAFADHTGVLPVLGAIVTNALHGVARWRTGRIWWGLGQRWVWNSLIVTFGFYDSAFSLDDPVLAQRPDGPSWLTGGGFGVEGGLVGIAFQLVIAGVIWRYATGRRGPWVVRR